MIELIKSEIGRFGKWIVIGVCLHFALLLVLVNFGVFINAGQGLGILSSVVYASVAMLFGIIQMRGFHHGGLWTFLINRPVPTYALAACLAIGGAFILISVVVLPQVMVEFSLDWLTNSVIDQRHYLQSFFILGLIASGYLAGCYLSLSPSNGAVLIVALPIMMIASSPLSGSLLWICIAIIVWQVILLASVFKPDLNSHSGVWGYRFANVVAFQLAGYFAICMAAGLAVQGYLMLAHGAGVTTSWNDYFGDDVFDRMETESGRERLIRSLDGLDDERKSIFQNQAELCDVHLVSPISGIYAPHQQMPFAQQSQHLMLDDPYNRIKWRFSHDQMAFVRADATSHAESEKLNVLAHEQPIELEQVPVVVDDQVVTPTAVYSYDADFKCLSMRFRIGDNGSNDNEMIVSSIENAGQRSVLLTTQALYFFESSFVANQSGLIAPSVRMPLPNSYENLHSIVVAELVDADLVSFLWGTHSEAGHYPAEQTTIRLAVDGTAQTLAVRELRNGFPATYRHCGFYVSPLIHTIWVSIIVPYTKSNSIGNAQRHGIPSIPLNLMVAIFLATAASVFLTWRLSRNRVPTRTSRWIWLAVVLVTSLAGLLSFVLLNRKRPSITIINPKVSAS